jgi:hypothetical protein
MTVNSVGCAFIVIPIRNLESGADSPRTFSREAHSEPGSTSIELKFWLCSFNAMWKEAFVELANKQ